MTAFWKANDEVLVLTEGSAATIRRRDDGVVEVKIDDQEHGTTIRNDDVVRIIVEVNP